jgi:hypothetical protein
MLLEVNITVARSSSRTHGDKSAVLTACVGAVLNRTLKTAFSRTRRPSPRWPRRDGPRAGRHWPGIPPRDASVDLRSKDGGNVSV